MDSEPNGPRTKTKLATDLGQGLVNFGWPADQGGAVPMAECTKGFTMGIAKGLPRTLLQELKLIPQELKLNITRTKWARN